MKYYYGGYQECIETIRDIDMLAGWPHKGTSTWATPKETTIPNVWAFKVPPESYPVDTLLPISEDITFLEQD